MKIQGSLAVLCLVLSSLATAAAPAPRFDYSTPQSARESNRLVAQHLPADRQDALKEAVIKLGAAEGAVSYTDADGKSQVGIPPERIRQILHGRTAEEVIELAAATPGPEVSLDPAGQ